MSELKPCPFCGAPDMDADENADVRKCVDRSGWLDGKGNRGPECLSCGATALSVEAWNRRAIIDPPAQGEAAPGEVGYCVRVPQDIFYETAMLISTLTDPNAKTPGRTDAARELLPKLQALLDGREG